MTEEELNAIVESKLEEQLTARLKADRDRVKLEVVMDLRRKAEREWYARINARHPIQGPGDPKVEAARIAAMRAGAARDAEHMARSNARVVEGSMEYRRRGEGFAIKPVGQR